MPSLVVLAPGMLHVADGALVAPEKFISGMSRYAAGFPGDVWLLGRPGGKDLDNLGSREVALETLPFGCLTAPDLADGLRELRADVALFSLSDEHPQLVGHARQSVFAAERAGRSWLAMALVEPHSLIGRIWMEARYRGLSLMAAMLADAAERRRGREGGDLRPGFAGRLTSIKVTARDQASRAPCRPGDRGDVGRLRGRARGRPPLERQRRRVGGGGRA